MTSLRAPVADDLFALAEAVAGSAAGDRARLARRLIDRAHAADKFRKRRKRPHPRWGDGTVMAAAMLHCTQGLLDLSSETGLSAVACAVGALVEWRADAGRSSSRRE